MKTNHYFTILAFFCFFVTTAQEDYLEIIAEKSCNCIQQKKETFERENKEITTTELGVCLFESAREYKDRLIADYELDMTNLAGEAGEKLGVLIGSKMAFVCPDLLMALGDTGEEYESLWESGKVQSISTDNFISFEIRNAEGKTQKFYWFTFVSSGFDLQNSFKELKNKEVEVEYLEQELFDPRIREYRKVNVLTALEVVDNIN